ncbi:MmcQ/YjbR family DNA-binding protein [Paracraurococcus lichenis]|uniref:MmcQ/YjbR family DNA-binding protein n=1 Tax=Paracraurococcus lichenis TaxID=3064888 RepID=A0ABT9E042_9PROT|nr:MmcQ/YjbR family DNA-binding protein [Paracraurococcus sp. LOR1-02]MDO9709490.1 MmcQ/YjbR family DNA-binding protein [Paracraurococcus sp. LOR1-02]
MAARPLARLRTICLRLPEAEERETWDVPTFRVRGKIFAMAPGEGQELQVWCKAPPGAQQVPGRVCRGLRLVSAGLFRPGGVRGLADATSIGCGRVLARPKNPSPILRRSLCRHALVGADPARFFAPPYLGPKGWIGIRLHPPPDWAEVAALLRRSYGLVAPKRLAAMLA